MLKQKWKTFAVKQVFSEGVGGSDLFDELISVKETTLMDFVILKHGEMIEELYFTWPTPLVVDYMVELAKEAQRVEMSDD